MTAQEIINQVRNLPIDEKRQVLEALQSDLNQRVELPAISESDVQRILYERGVIGNMPDASAYTDEDDEFEPIEIDGKPLSESVIEERR